MTIETGIKRSSYLTLQPVFSLFPSFSGCETDLFCHSDGSIAGPRSQSGNPVLHWWASDIFKVPWVTDLLIAWFSLGSQKSHITICRKFGDSVGMESVEESSVLVFSGIPCFSQLGKACFSSEKPTLPMVVSPVFTGTTSRFLSWGRSGATGDLFLPVCWSLAKRRRYRALTFLLTAFPNHTRRKPSSHGHRNHLPVNTGRICSGGPEDKCGNGPIYWPQWPANILKSYKIAHLPLH